MKHQTERRAFIASELDALYRFEVGSGPVEADYGYGVGYNDAARVEVQNGRKVLAMDRAYLCERCGFETRSPSVIYDHAGACGEVSP